MQRARRGCSGARAMTFHDPPANDIHRRESEQSRKQQAGCKAHATLEVSLLWDIARELTGANPSSPWRLKGTAFRSPRGRGGTVRQDTVVFPASTDRLPKESVRGSPRRGPSAGS